MTARKILTLFCATLVLAEARWHMKRDTHTICDSYKNPSKILCMCTKDARQPDILKSAECYLTAKDVTPTDHTWDSFDTLESLSKLSLTNARGYSLEYIPTHGLKHTKNLIQLDVKYSHIERVHPYAFANISTIEEISIKDSHVSVLAPHSFANLKELIEIKLDKNNIMEINRDIFINIPSLERLFLTDNHITTIHDKAFIHLGSLKELEINMNKLFSLNSETFSGLKNLEKLDLSYNNLEVIGDNTFLPLRDLKILNIEGNKLQMLDEKAFRGLGKLHYLSLANNKLVNIDNRNVFTPLQRLKVLNLRANGIRDWKGDVLVPLMHHFLEEDGHLDVEDNEFPCDCRLEWFANFINKTRNKNLKISMENLKCIPDAKLTNLWNAYEEAERNSAQALETDGQGADYEYYDETQLNGKLFYTDVREIIHCNKNRTITSTSITIVETTTELTKTTKATSPITITTRLPTTIPTETVPTAASTKTTTTTTPIFIPRTKENKYNHGLLDLSVDETTPKETPKEDVIDKKENELGNGEKASSTYTTSRLVTVSAKPIEETNVYDNMASDEAKPDKLKAQRSVQEDYLNKMNNGQRVNGCVALVSLILCIRLFH